MKKSRAVGRKTFLTGGINAKIEVQESKDPSPLLSSLESFFGFSKHRVYPVQGQKIFPSPREWSQEGD